MEREKPNQPTDNVIDFNKIREAREIENLKNDPEIIIKDLSQILECIERTSPDKEEQIEKFKGILEECGFDQTEITNIILSTKSGRYDNLAVFLNENMKAAAKLHNNLEKIINIVSQKSISAEKNFKTTAGAKIKNINEGREGEVDARLFRNEFKEGFEKKLLEKNDLREKIREMLKGNKRREVDERLLKNEFEETFGKKLSDQGEEDIQEKLKNAYRSKNEKEKKILLDILRKIFCLSEERINEICAFLEKPKKK